MKILRTMFKRDRNTKKKGTLHFRIFKWNGRYLGICKETGFVEESLDYKEVLKKLQNGMIALLKAVNKSSQNLEPSLNTSPPLKYAVLYYIAPVLIFIELFRDMFKWGTGFYSFFEESIPGVSLKNG